MAVRQLDGGLTLYDNSTPIESNGKFYKTDVITQPDGSSSSFTYETNAEGSTRGRVIQERFVSSDGELSISGSDDVTAEEAAALEDSNSPLRQGIRDQVTQNKEAAEGEDIPQDPGETTEDPNAENPPTDGTAESGGGEGNNSPAQPVQQQPKLPSGPPLVYPETRDELMDYLKITPLRYVPGGFNAGALTTPGAASKSTEEIGRAVFLPMQPALQDSNSTSWGDDSLNALQIAGAGIAMDAIDRVSDGKFFEASEKLVTDTGNALNNFANAPGTGDFVKAYFAGKAVGANVLGRATGAVLNNNLELLFKGPTLRSFNYNYKFTPRSPSEAAIIKEIILQFKRVMAVKRDNVGLFLKSPDVFKLQYIFGSTGQQHPFMNKLKTCALTNMTVDYTPDGTYMTYGDGSMTSYNVSLQFSELEPIYRSDQDEDGGIGF